MINRLSAVTILAAAAAIVSISGPATAQDPLELEEYTEETAYREDWGLAITPYAWFAAQSTDVGKTQLRSSFNDLASITNLGFQCRLYATFRWLVFTADWTYADMKSESEILTTELDLRINQHILDMKLGGKVYDTRSTVQDGGMAIWVSAGARYWDNSVDYTVTTTPLLPGQDPSVDTGEEAQSWWDPVLGIHMHFPVTPRVGFIARATGGGLGVGKASDYMWDAEFAALFRLTDRMLISAGYRQFKYRREDGGVTQTVTVIGPAVGLSVGIL